MKLTKFLFVAAFVLALGSPSSALAQQAAVNDAPAPVVKLKGIDGKTYDLAEMRGQVVLVSFGATWCGPCVWELTAIEELKEEYKDKPVKFLWVSIESDDQTSNDVLKHYAKSQRLTIPVLRDPEKEVFAQFSNSVRIPLVVLFDRKGNFAAPSHRGMTPRIIEYKMKMRERIDALLADQTNASAEASK